MDRAAKIAKDKAAKTYNAAADFFDDEALSFWNKYGSATVSRLQLAKGASVLDVACGSGASALPAAEAVGGDGKVIAVDLSENLLLLGRAKASAGGINNIDFVCKDMTALPYPDEKFDAVICVFGIFFVPDMVALLKEFWRMVKPGGKLAVTTWGPHLFAPVYDIWRAAVKTERPDLYSAFNPWDLITDVHSVRNLFNSAGIVQVDVVSESGHQPLHAPNDWWKIVLGSGLRWTVDQMGVDAALRVREQNSQWIETNDIRAIETNVIYAIAAKKSS
ncbi:MAG TPA: class I SAM-dependent methyltransferase [Chitinophagaceae bacterium]|nr:class I SAM-dependent methyltransferase [Chitinophagaceae bacterium]